MQRGTPYGWWLGSAAEYRLYQTTFAGDTLRIVERPYEPIPFSGSDEESASPRQRLVQEQVRRLPADRRPPDYQRIFFGFIEDEEGYLWVMLTPPPEASGTPLDVFDPTGRSLGLVKAPSHPESWPPPVVRGRMVYAVIKDELDMPYVGVLRIHGRD